MQLAIDLPIEEQFGVPEKDEFELAKDYFAECKIRGFNRSAIVALKSGGFYAGGNERRWGVILTNRDWVSHQFEGRNLTVYWLESGKETHQEMDELILVNPAPPHDVFVKRLREMT